MSYQNRRDNHHDDRRYGDNRGVRRENGGGGGGVTCFYCKEPGHRINDCPKKANKGQRGGGQGFRNNRNNNGNNNNNSLFSATYQKEKDNFVYEDNCPPPQDEDWGGGDDSEEEKKKKKKESKKVKKQQEMEGLQEQDHGENREYVKQEWENEDNNKLDLNTKENERKENQQNVNSEVTQNDPQEEDWGGNGYEEQKNKNNEEQDQIGLSLEDQILAQFGAIPVHSSRAISDTNQRRETKDSEYRSKDTNRGQSRERNRDSNRDQWRGSSRERNRDSSRERRDKYDNKFTKQRSYEYSSSRREDDERHSDKRDRRDDRRDDKYRRDDDKYRRDDDRSRRDYDRNKNDNNRNRRDDDRNRDRHNDHQGGGDEKPLRDRQWGRQESRKSQDRYEKLVTENKDDITDKINEMLMAKAFGGPEVDLSNICKMAEEETQKEEETHEEWTLEDVVHKESTTSQQNSTYQFDNGGFNNKSSNQSRNNNYKSNDDEDWGGGGGNNNSFSKQEFNSSFKKSQNSYNNSYNNNNHRQRNQYHNNNNDRNNNYNHNRYNNNLSLNKKSVSQPVVIISDDEDDPWASPKKNQKSSLSNMKTTTTAPNYKQNLSNLVNTSNPFQYYESPVYEPNKESDEEGQIKKSRTNNRGLLFNPDEGENNGVNNNTTPPLPIQELNSNLLSKLSIENIYDFEEKSTEKVDESKLHMKEEFSSCVKFYDELPEEAYELGYDRYSDFFKGNLLNFLYPHKSNERNCLKVYEGDIKMRRLTEQGQLTVAIKAQVYTNHPWNVVKWIPSLRLLRQKDRIKEFQTMDFSTAASQLKQIIPKENYDRVFYLYWIEGLNQEDEDKLEEYSNYLCSRKLLSGVNFETGCYTMGSINQIFPQVESYYRASEFKKKTPIKLFLIFNPEIGLQVTYKNVPF